jgi:HK97 family phage prohead protease
MKFEPRGKWLRQTVEVRAEDSGVTVEGYAAVFNQATDIAGLFREQIAPGAFDDAIGRDDVVFLVNHDGLPLARTRSGTLELSQDDHGLKMRSVLDETDPDVQKIAGKMKRGDLDKMSFAFYPEIEEWDDSGRCAGQNDQKSGLGGRFYRYNASL